jgi:hypothetical protein
MQYAAAAQLQLQVPLRRLAQSAARAPRRGLAVQSLPSSAPASAAAAETGAAAPSSAQLHTGRHDLALSFSGSGVMLIYQMGVADVLRSDPTFMARVAQVLVRPLRMGGGAGGESMNVSRPYGRGRLTLGTAVSVLCATAWCWYPPAKLAGHQRRCVCRCDVAGLAAGLRSGAGALHVRGAVG